MKPMLRIMLVLGLFFASGFVIIKMTGLITLEKIESWFQAAKDLPPEYTALIVIGLLLADLIISVPTMTIMILSGFFLGHAFGALAGITGLMLTGCTGYVLSYFLGQRMISFLVKDPDQRVSAEETFLKHGFVVIMLSRAIPMLPEISACMAGMTKMRFPAFLVAWSISAVPYTLIATYAGSISSLDNPLPAIITAIGLTGSFWLGWYVFRQIGNRRMKA